MNKIVNKGRFSNNWMSSGALSLKGLEQRSLLGGGK